MHREACVLRHLRRGVTVAFSPSSCNSKMIFVACPNQICWASNIAAPQKNASVKSSSSLRPRIGSARSLKTQRALFDSIYRDQPSHFRFQTTAAAAFSSSSSTATSTEPAAAPPAALSEQLRAAMRHLPHSVVVCTSHSTDHGSPSPSSSPAAASPEPRGMTMSSFTSLSLHPTPVVTFNIATPSRTLDAVSQSRHFNIHVLSGDAEGARVADWFRRGNATDLGVFDAGKMLEGCGCEVISETKDVGMRTVVEEEGEARVTRAEGDDDAPLLRGAGVLYALRCRLLADDPHRGLVRVRDHVVVLAEVVKIVQGSVGREHIDEEEVVFGLVHADRKYRQLDATPVVNQ